MKGDNEDDVSEREQSQRGGMHSEYRRVKGDYSVWPSTKRQWSAWDFTRDAVNRSNPRQHMCMCVVISTLEESGLRNVHGGSVFLDRLRVLERASQGENGPCRGRHT